MINPKYFADMQAFPSQFAHTQTLSLPDTFPQRPRVIICGMWGSALYVPFILDLLQHHNIDARIDVCSTYSLPQYDPASTVIVCASHSGNTEETIHCFHEALSQWAHLVVFASGGKLRELAEANDIPIYQIPTGMQPRLSTWFFINALLDLLAQLGYPTQEIQQTLQACAHDLPAETIAQARAIAHQLLTKTPIIYTTDVLKSMSLICKIKYNENSKTPAFAHYIPELNHNEMCGRTWHTLDPHFLIFTSRHTHPRNLRRIEVLCELLQQEWYAISVFDPQGDTLEAEALWIYQFVDYITYFLAEAKNIDPEPVVMIEKFKAAL
jgi:glucose/mannose-6-phosphate isomerase